MFFIGKLMWFSNNIVFFFINTEEALGTDLKGLQIY